MYSLMRMLYAASGEELNPKLIKSLKNEDSASLILNLIPGGFISKLRQCLKNQVLSAPAPK